MSVAAVLRPTRGQRGSAEAYRADVERFAAALEAYVQAYPWQFFNYHDLWAATPAPAPSAAGGAAPPDAGQRPR